MKIKAYSIAMAIAAFLGVSGTAGAAEQGSDLNNMLTSLSNMLSNSSPRAGGDDDSATPAPVVKSIHSGASQASVPVPLLSRIRSCKFVNPLLVMPVVGTVLVAGTGMT